MSIIHPMRKKTKVFLANNLVLVLNIFVALLFVLGLGLVGSAFVEPSYRLLQGMCGVLLLYVVWWVVRIEQEVAAWLTIRWNLEHDDDE